jgi:hypothetical protein
MMHHGRYIRAMVGVDAALFADATGLDPLEETGLGAFLLGRPH